MFWLRGLLLHPEFLISVKMVLAFCSATHDIELSWPFWIPSMKTIILRKTYRKKRGGIFPMSQEPHPENAIQLLDMLVMTRKL